MGGLGPGIGGFEILVIGLVALLVVGPKDLPVLMRKVGKAMARARAMANDFRASFDEMARQSELDELRKEVEALRRTQMVPLGPEAEATFRQIDSDLSAPAVAPTASAQPLLTGPEEFADPGPSADDRPAETTAAATKASKSRAKGAKAAASKSRAKTTTSASASDKPRSPATKAKTARKKAVDL